MSEAEVHDIDIADITIDNTYQMREEIPDCSEYAELLTGDKWPFPPVVVYRVGRGKSAKFLLVSGFTRIAAAKAKGRSTVMAEVRDGSKADALLFALSENGDHGYRRTGRDKRKAVIRCKGAFPDYSGNEIAKAVGVTRQFVAQVFREIAGEQGVRAMESVPESKPNKSVAVAHKDPTANYGDCPVCKANAWDEHNDGVRCIACGHYHGEPAAVDDEELEGAATQPEPRDDDTEKPLKDRIKDGMREVGRITRYLEEIGLMSRDVAKALTGLREAVSSVKE